MKLPVVLAIMLLAGCAAQPEKNSPPQQVAAVPPVPAPTVTPVKQPQPSEANRKNSLKGSIAVKVIDVQTNGTLRVQGEKWLTINNNRELVRITGLVRPEDIDTKNKVLSERLAESKLEYLAVGNNADIHEPGWLTRALNSPWFPF